MDYTMYADLVGTTVKSLWAPMFPEKQHRDAFNAMVDAKVNLNKSIYVASKDFIDKVNTASKTFVK